MHWSLSSIFSTGEKKKKIKKTNELNKAEIEDSFLKLKASVQSLQQHVR
jgi:hypothetical protein